MMNAHKKLLFALCGHQAQEHCDMLHIDGSSLSTLLIKCFNITKGKVLHKYRLLLLPFSGIYDFILIL